MPDVSLPSTTRTPAGITSSMPFRNAGSRSPFSRMVADEIEAQRRFEQSLPPLTPAQLEVLSLLSKGLSNQDIGRILNISPNSVKDRLKLTFARLGVANRTEAVAFALRQNLLG